MQEQNKEVKFEEIKMKYNNETIDTGDGHKWIYDWKSQEWIDVEPSPKLKKLIAEGYFVRVR